MYSKHFKIADDLICHLDTIIGSISDPFIQSRYAGFVAVAATTVFELAVKEIFIDFGERKHKVLGNFAASYFYRINGRIKIPTIKDEYISKFGSNYVKKWTKKIGETENNNLKQHRISVIACYQNLIEWRNQFTHEGKMPSTATYDEIKKAYFTGKIVIDCLAKTMNR